MRKAFSFILSLMLFSAIALVTPSCTPTGASTGTALSEGYQAPQSGSAVDQTESMRSQYRDWMR